MSYEFQSTLYPTSRDMHAAIAYEYLSAGGLNDHETLVKYLDCPVEYLADDAIDEWSLDGLEGFDRGELVDALDDLHNQLRLSWRETAAR